MLDDWRWLLGEPFEIHSVDGTSSRSFQAADVSEVVLEMQVGNQFDGRVYRVVVLSDGRCAAITAGYSNLAPPTLESVWVGASVEAVTATLPPWVRAKLS